MATISENLQTIKTSFDNIKQAIIAKGGNADGDITTWGNAIGAIESGDMSLLGGIKNKLNGTELTIPVEEPADKTPIYTYEIENPDPNTYDYVYIVVVPYDYAFRNSTNYSVLVNGIPMIVNYESTYSSGFNESSGHSNWSHTIFCIKNNGIIQIATSGTSDLVICRYIYSTYTWDNVITNINAYNYCRYPQVYLMGHRITPINVGGVSIDIDLLDTDTFTFKTAIFGCFKEDTEITLADLSKKKVQDITYNDKLLVWDFDNGCVSSDDVFWIKKEHIANYFYRVTLENGNIIELVGSNGKCHRLFNYDDQIFESATDLVGNNVYTQNGISKVISCEKIEESCKYYNIITGNHINLFANDILTSCKYNNALPIKDMKFDYTNAGYDSDRLRNCMLAGLKGADVKWYHTLKLQYNRDIPIEYTIKYIENLNKSRKTLTDFEGNEELFNDIEETEVGWIDRKGKAYGFKHYMPGQQNHILLADKICKDLNIETDNPSRYLEKAGWLKYTTDFVLNSDDKEVNEEQLRKLCKFLKVPNKLKRDGKIRIGNYSSPHVDIEEFDTMDRYTFEYKKKYNRSNW